MIIIYFYELIYQMNLYKLMMNDELKIYNIIKWIDNIFEWIRGYMWMYVIISRWWEVVLNDGDYLNWNCRSSKWDID